MAPSLTFSSPPPAHIKEKESLPVTSTASLQNVASQHITKAVGRLTDHVFASGKGLIVTTTEGEELLDFTSGIGVTSLGHCHPVVTAAIIEQAQSIVHVQCAIALSKPYTTLISNLVPMMPDPQLNNFFLWNSGSEAIEAAIKVVRTYTRRNNIIVMQGGYHGRTSGATALTRSKTSFFAGTGPLMPCVFTTPFPYWHAMGLPTTTSEENLVAQAVYQLEQVLAQQSAPTDTAAIFVEPVMGEGGYVPAPASFLQALRRICDLHGILLVADEIQTGFGRTGKMFAVEHSGVVPDVMTFAKGVANGMPVSGIVTKKHIMDSMPSGSLGGTYSGNAVACAAAVATTNYLVQNNIIESVNARSKQLFEGLRKIQSDVDNGGWLIAEVRGVGLMAAIEFRDPKSPITGIHSEGIKLNSLCSALHTLVQKECMNRGLLVLTTSVFPVLRLIPALIVSEEEVDKALQVIADSVATVAHSLSM